MGSRRWGAGSGELEMGSWRWEQQRLPEPSWSLDLPWSCKGRWFFVGRPSLPLPEQYTWLGFPALWFPWLWDWILPMAPNISPTPTSSLSDPKLLSQQKEKRGNPRARSSAWNFAGFRVGTLGTRDPQPLVAELLEAAQTTPLSPLCRLSPQPCAQNWALDHRR